MSISRCPLFDCRSKCLLVSLLVCLNGCLGNYASVKSFIYTTLYWTNNWMIILSAALSFLCADTRLKIRVSSLNRYLFCDSRSCPNNQSCLNIQQGKTLRFRCPLQSAPVRTDTISKPEFPGTDGVQGRPSACEVQPCARCDFSLGPSGCRRRMMRAAPGKAADPGIRRRRQ